MTILISLLPMLLRLVGIFLDKSAASAKSKQAYFDFLHALASDEENSATLRQSALDQKNRIMEQINADASAVKKPTD